MKKTNALITLSIILILTSCSFDKQEVEFKKSEIIGHWIQTNKNDDENMLQSGVEKINFKEDFTAEIEIHDSDEYKTVSGIWEIQPERNMGFKNSNFSFTADLAITFDKDKSNREIMTLTVDERNKKKILNGGTLIFEKE